MFSSALFEMLNLCYFIYLFVQTLGKKQGLESSYLFQAEDKFIIGRLEIIYFLPTWNMLAQRFIREKECSSVS